MTEKEKAKAYDEALERAKKLHDKIDIKEIFPELNESEDERIKKAIIEFFESEDDDTTYSLVRKKDIIDWLEKQGKEEYGLKSFKDEDVRKFMQYIEKQAKAYEFNLPNRSYDIYAFAKDLLVWLEKQSEQESSQINERVWLYLISDVLTWKDGIGQYLDDPRVQELAKRLCKEYAQKLYNPSNTGKNEPKFKVGDWVVNKFGDSWHIDSLDKKNYQVSDGKGNYNYFPISKQDEMHLWTIQDAKDGDVLAAHECYVVFKEIDGLNIKCHCTYHYLGLNPSFYIDTLQNKDAFLPATKEQRDTLMKAMNDAGYEWDTEKKELKKEKVE